LTETIDFGPANSQPHIEPLVDKNGTVISPQSITTTYTYDPLFSKMISKTDPEGNTTLYVIDGLSQFDSTGQSISFPAGAPAATGNTGNLLANIDAVGNVTEYRYDSFGNVLKMIDPRGEETNYSDYDAYGNSRRITDAENNVTTQIFDVRSRLRSKIGTSGRHHRTEYDYDGLDRMIEETKFDDVFNLQSEMTLYDYKPNGELKLLTDGLGQDTEHLYDRLNRKIFTIDYGIEQAIGGPVDISVEYHYDQDSNLILEVDGRGIAREHIYDELNRRVMTRIVGSPAPSTTVGIGNVIMTADYDVVNNKLFETDLNKDRTDFVYDGLFRIVRTDLPFVSSFTDTPHGSGRVHIDTRYDLVGNKVRETDGNGQPTAYFYDDIYRLEKKTDAVGNSVSYVYDPSSNVVREIHTNLGFPNPKYEIVYDNGSFIIDGLSRPTMKTEKVSLGDPTTAPVVDYVTTFVYDDANNRVVTSTPRGNDANDPLSGLGGTAITEDLQDGLGRLHIQIADAGGLNLTTTYNYDGNGNQITVKDPEGGNVDITYTYDGLNRKIKAEYLLGLTEEFIYDSNNNLIEYLDKRNIKFINTYDILDRKLTKEVIENITGSGSLALMTYTYNDPANIITEEDANGNVTRKHYDGLQRLTTLFDPITQPANFMIEYEYDGVNKRQKIDKKLHVTKYKYDGINRLVLTEELGSTINPPKVDGIVVAKTLMRVEYLDGNKRVIETDRRGIKSISQNDSLGRQIRFSRQDPALVPRYGTDTVILEEYDYDHGSNKVEFRDGNGNRTTYEYDGANRMLRMTEGVGSAVAAEINYTYDNVNNLLTKKDGRGIYPFDLQITYDDRYRKETETNGEGETIQYNEYDGNDNLLKMTEPLGGGRETLYDYDELNKLILVDETRGGVGGQTIFVYDGNRNKIAQQDANGNLVTYAYDALNRLTDTFQHFTTGTLVPRTSRGSVPAGGGLHWEFKYDANNNQNLVIDANGQRIDRTYDYLNRLEALNFSNHLIDPDTIDFQTLFSSYGYDGNSNMTSSSETKRVGGVDVTETYSYVFDKLDRVQEVTNYDNKTIHFTYDKQGNRTSVTDPDGSAPNPLNPIPSVSTTTYEYDRRNRLETAVTELGATSYTYWEDNLIKSIVYANGAVADYSFNDSFDNADRITKVVNHFSAVGTDVQPGDPLLISRYEYTYDDNSNRLQQVETHREITSGLPERTVYRYDLLNRLERSIYGPNGDNGDITYTYQKNGNRASEAGKDPVDPSQTIDRSYHYDRINRLRAIVNNVDPAAGFGFDYDDNGNRLSKSTGRVSVIFDANSNPITLIINPTDVVTYEYGIRNELLRTAKNAGDSVRFDYDYDRKRVKKITVTDETRYLYDQNATLIEYSDTGEATIKYNYGYLLLSVIDITTPGSLDPAQRISQFYHRDGLGSTSDLTNEAGDIQISHKFDAYGDRRELDVNGVSQEFGTSVNPKQYTGHYFDAETDLHYFKARYYDDETGIFITQDPNLGDINTPPSLHRYMYAYANPLRFVDLTGYQAEEANTSTTSSSTKSAEAPNVEKKPVPKASPEPSTDPTSADSAKPSVIRLPAAHIEITDEDIYGPSRHFEIDWEDPDESYGPSRHFEIDWEDPDESYGPSKHFEIDWDAEADPQETKRGVVTESKQKPGGGVKRPAKDLVKAVFEKTRDQVIGDALEKWIPGLVDMRAKLGDARFNDVTRMEKLPSGNLIRSADQVVEYSKHLKVQDSLEVLKKGAKIAKGVFDVYSFVKDSASLGEHAAKTLYSESQKERVVSGVDVAYTSAALIQSTTTVVSVAKAGLTALGVKGLAAAPAAAAPGALTGAAAFAAPVLLGTAVAGSGILLKESISAAYEGRETPFEYAQRAYGQGGLLRDARAAFGGEITMVKNVIKSLNPFSGQTGSTTGFGAPILESIDMQLSPVVQEAVRGWLRMIPRAGPIQIKVEFSDLPGATVGRTTNIRSSQHGLPSSGTVILDVNAAGVGWFVDDTPSDHKEFVDVLGATAFRAATGSVAKGKYDVLTVLTHEMGHLLGLDASAGHLSNHMQTLDGSQVLAGEDFTVTLTTDGHHIDDAAHPHQALNEMLEPGVRRLPGVLDVAVIRAIRGLPGRSVGTFGDFAEVKTLGTSTEATTTEVVQGSVKLQENATGIPSSGAAPAASTLFSPANVQGNGVVNGNFEVADPNDPQFGWTTRGNTTVVGGQAVLSEDSVLLAGLSQTFTIPDNAEALRFTIVGANLGDDNTINPPDAFEVALLDPDTGTDTGTALLGTAAGLAGSDALLNIQPNGTVYFGPAVTVPGAGVSGDAMALNFPLTIAVDLTSLAAETPATLYFDLLGFGAVDSVVVIDNVQLLTGGQSPPAAGNDTASTTEGTAVDIDVLANDEDPDEVLDRTSVVVVTAPAHGTAQVLADGTIRYTPDEHFSGTDRIDYTVSDTAGTPSNPARVEVTVVPLANTPALTVQPAEGDADTAIPLSITAALADGDGSETLVILIEDLPTGAGLSAGRDNGDGSFTLTPEDLIGLTLTPAPNSGEDFTLTVTAVATEQSNNDSASLQTFLEVTVHAVNEPPVVADQTFSVDERSVNGTVVGMVAASDPDAGDMLTFAIVDGNDSGTFAIDPASGEITVADTSQIDFITAPRFDLTVRVEDSNGSSDTTMVTIDVFFSLATIGDFVWEDINGDGVQDAGVPGLAGVEVNLYNDQDTLVASATTDTSGAYRFEDVDANFEYDLEFLAPAGFRFSPQDQGGEDALDSDADPATGRTARFSLTAPENIGWDAGLYRPGEIHGMLWHDIDADGQRSVGEEALSGWTVFLDANENGELDPGESTESTDPDGKFSFTDLKPGAYVVAEVLPAEWKQTHPGPSGAAIMTKDGPLGSTHAAGAGVPIYLPGDPVEVAGTTRANTLINLDAFLADDRFAEIDGGGLTAVVVDTGIDLDHPFFGPDDDGDGVADRIVYHYDFADDDNDAGDVNGHGSHVSSILGSSDPAFPGVAPGVDLIHLKVFHDSGEGYFFYLEEALQWVADHADTYKIAAVNMSLSDGLNWPGATDQYGIGDELAALAGRGLIVVASAGNEFHRFDSAPGLAYPAADPTVVAVGAVWDADRGGPWRYGPNGAQGTDFTTGADRITAFSQRHPDLLDTLAPGALISGANATGGVRTLLGTSQASPYITGVAVLAQQIAERDLGRRITPTEFRHLLSASGVSVYDGDDEDDNVANLDASMARIDVLALAEQLLLLDPDAPAEDLPGGEHTDAGHDQTLPTVQAFTYTVEIQSGEIVSGLDFGNRLINEPPTVDDQTFSVDENSPDGTAVGTVLAGDPDPSDILTFAIVGGTGSTAFALDPASGELTTADAGQLDFESTPSFTLEVEVTDRGGRTDTAIITVDLNDVNEAPIILDTDLILSASTIDENSLLTLAGSFADPDTGDAHTVTIDWGDGNIDTQALASGDRTFTAIHRYLDDDPAGYTIDVSVTDIATGVGTAGTNVTVNNLAPTANLTDNGPVSEGSIALVSFANQFDPSSTDTDAGFTYSYDFNNDGIFEIVDSLSA